MTEYESWEVLNGLTANLMQQEALFVGAFTAYVIAAHWVGRTLSTFQVCFITIVYALLSLLGLRSQLWFLSNIQDVSEGIEGIIKTENTDGLLISGGFVIVRIFLILGAIFYMWQIRNSKAD